MPVAVRISSAVWLRAELPRQRRFIAGTGIGDEYAAINSAATTEENAPASAMRKPMKIVDKDAGNTTKKST